MTSDTDKKLKIYCIAGFLFVSILGTAAHFFYEWTGNNFLIGLFTPVNESTWEHIKLLYFPMVIYSFFLWMKLGEEYPCLSSALPGGILLGCFLIPVLFYTYSGILGTNITFVDIAIFFISTAAAFFAVYKLTLSCKAGSARIILLLAAAVLGILFMLFTVNPPDLGLFRVP